MIQTHINDGVWNYMKNQNLASPSNDDWTYLSRWSYHDFNINSVWNYMKNQNVASPL